MFIITRSYRKPDNSELYDIIMEFINSGSQVKALKETAEGFVGVRGSLNPNGTIFTVKESWTSEAAWSTWLRMDPATFATISAPVRSFILTHNLIEAISDETVPD